MMQAYSELIQQRLKDNYCPLCNEWTTNYIDSNETAYVVPARTPYELDHILICPKAHLELQSQCTHQQLVDMSTLLYKWTDIMYQNHQELVVFMRQWAVLGKTGKSIWHLHWHIIPNFTIQYGWSQVDSDARMFMSDEQYQDIVSYLKSYI
jgi:diadenosine tetraphosphate (Ap4A) HIT family hydrolase